LFCTPLSAGRSKPYAPWSGNYETVLCVSVSIRDYYEAIFRIPSAVRSLHLQFCNAVQLEEGLMPEIVVHALDGRSVEQKRALIKDLTDAVVRNYDVDAGTVTINIVESARENKARGGVLFSDVR
jgi:4-oxalocrotonate tautomerase